MSCRHSKNWLLNPPKRLHYVGYSISIRVFYSYSYSTGTLFNHALISLKPHWLTHLSKILQGFLVSRNIMLMFCACTLDSYFCKSWKKYRGRSGWVYLLETLSRSQGFGTWSGKWTRSWKALGWKGG